MNEEQATHYELSRNFGIKLEALRNSVCQGQITEEKFVATLEEGLDELYELWLRIHPDRKL